MVWGLLVFLIFICLMYKVLVLGCFYVLRIFFILIFSKFKFVLMFFVLVVVGVVVLWVGEFIEIEDGVEEEEGV